MIETLGKTPDQAMADRQTGLVIAFVVFALILASVVVVMRRLRLRVEAERADRALRESIDRLDGEP